MLVDCLTTLYVLLVFCLYFISFCLISSRLYSHVIAENTGPIFVQFLGLVVAELEVAENANIYFTIARRTLPWQTILRAKLAKFAYPLHS